MSTQSFYLQNIEKGSVGRLDRGVIIKKALWTARRKAEQDKDLVS